MNGAHILVVDDDEMIRELCVIALRDHYDYRVSSCANGAEAVELIEAMPDIALVLMDIMMPRMDGIEAAAHINAIRPELPILFMSAFTHKAEVSLHIEKPFSIDDLAAQVMLALET